MSGTSAGSKKAVVKILEKNPNHFREIGKLGGQNGHTGGFAANPELASIAGQKGGRISRRTAKVHKVEVMADEPLTIEVFNDVPVREQAIREFEPTKQEVADGKVSRLIKRLFTSTSSK